MAVIIGSARIDERGKARGGKAGDQTGREVSTQNWYKHSKNWVCIRAKDPLAAAKIAAAMKAACANANIGYDQGQRLTLYNAAKAVGFDPAKVKTPVETDCSALVRVCCAFAGITVGNFTTANQVSALRATGEFEILTESKYVNQSAYLRKGDILVTKTQGHTVVVLNDGPKAEYPQDARPLGSRDLKRGSSGPDVTALQEALAALGFDPQGIDGQYGTNTANAVKAYQRARGLTVDGEFGPQTFAALEGDLAAQPEPEVQPEPELTEGIRVTGGTVNIRTGPGTEYAIAAVVKQGDTLEAAAADADGWHPVLVGGEVRWISGKMSEAVKKG